MSFGVWQIILIIFFVLIVPYFPSIFVLRKAGWSGWGYLLFLVPLVNLVWLWVFAFGHWPNIVRDDRPHPT